MKKVRAFFAKAPLFYKEYEGKLRNSFRGACSGEVINMADIEQDNYQYLTEKYLAKRQVLLSYAGSVLCNRDLADEAVQQTFEIAWRRIEDWRSSPNPDGWLFKTLSFVLLNIKKRQRMERYLFARFEGGFNPDKVAAPEESIPMRTKYGPLLDTPQFKMVYEAEVLGKPLIEIAEELGISLVACRKRVERAKKFLRRNMK